MWQYDTHNIMYIAQDLFDFSAAEPFRSSQNSEILFTIYKIWELFFHFYFLYLTKKQYFALVSTLLKERRFFFSPYHIHTGVVVLGCILQHTGGPCTKRILLLEKNIVIWNSVLLGFGSVMEKWVKRQVHCLPNCQIFAVLDDFSE